MHDKYDPDDLYWADAAIEELKGNLDVMDCPSCGGHNTMKIDSDKLFFCPECSMILDEESAIRLYLKIDTLED